MISEDLLEELAVVATKRRKWWAIKFADYGYYGEVVEEEADEGFDLKLFASKRAAEGAAREFVEEETLSYEVVEICLTDVR